MAPQAPKQSADYSNIKILDWLGALALLWCIGMYEAARIVFKAMTGFVIEV